MKRTDLDNEELFFRCGGNNRDDSDDAANVIIHLLPLDLAMKFRAAANSTTGDEQYQHLHAAMEAVVEKAVANADSDGRVQCPLCKDGSTFKPLGLERHLKGEMKAHLCEVMRFVAPYTRLRSLREERRTQHSKK